MRVAEVVPAVFFIGEKVGDFISKVVYLEDEGLLKMHIMYMHPDFCGGSDDDFSIAHIENYVVDFFKRHVIEYSALNTVGDTIIVLYRP